MILNRSIRNNFTKMRALALLLACLGTTVLTPIDGRAAPLPGGINQQGFLTDSQGRPLNGAFRIEARLFTSATQGEAQYSELHEVLVQDGLYSLSLGHSPHDPQALERALEMGAFYLELTLNGKVLSPRTQLQATPFAIWSKRVGPGAVDSEQIVDGAITAQKIAPDAISSALIDGGFKHHFDTQFDAISPLLEQTPLQSTSLRESSCRSAPQSPLSLTIAGQVFPQVLAFQAQEEISTLSRTVVLFESNAQSAVATWIDANANLSFTRNDGVRHFAGIVTHAAKLGGSESSNPNFARFAIVIEPPAARLRYEQRSRIFQDRTVAEIAAENLTTSGQAFSTLFSQASLSRSQMVQYQESDLDLTFRLLEQEGIWFALDTSSSSPAMLLSDDSSNHLGTVALSFYGPGTEPEDSTEEYVQSWLSDTARHSNSVILKSHPRDTGSVLEQSFSLGSGTGSLRRSAGRVEDSEDLAQQARSQAQESWHRQHLSGGFSNSASLSPGRRLQVADRTGAGHSASYWLTKLTHTALVVFDREVCVYYANKFSVASTDVLFKPARRTPKPIIPGLASAVVTGPSGEARHTDDLGRVKLKFPWDDEAENDETSSAWVPVLMGVHGRNQSAFWIPEVGDEVLVSFINGDPDRPVVVGAIANQIQPPPMALPDNKFKTSIGSRSGTNTLTGFTFDSTAGAESLRLDSRTIDVIANNAIHMDAPLTDFSGAVQANEALGPNARPLEGGYYRDNAIVAWARISAVGAPSPSFGIDNVTRVSPGYYVVGIDQELAGTRIIPVATAEVDNHPQSLDELRVVSVNQLKTGVFEIFVNTGEGKPVDNDIVFVATGG